MPLAYADSSVLFALFYPRDMFHEPGNRCQRHASSHPCGATDVLHVAAAIEQVAPLFLTCDAQQAALAQAAGLAVYCFEA